MCFDWSLTCPSSLTRVGSLGVSSAGVVTCPVLVNNPTKIPIRMRVKVMYDTPQGHFEEMGEISQFPPNAI